MTADRAIQHARDDDEVYTSRVDLVDQLIRLCAARIPPKEMAPYAARLSSDGGSIDPGEILRAADVFSKFNERCKIVCVAWHAYEDERGVRRSEGVTRYLQSVAHRRRWTSRIVMKDYAQAREAIGTALGLPGFEFIGFQLARDARKKESATPGVYLIRCETTGRLKIGKSMDVSQRLRTHAVMLPGGRMPGPLKCVRVIACHERMAAVAESMMHFLCRAGRVDVTEIFEPFLDFDPESIQTIEELIERFSEQALRSIREGTV